MSRWDLGGLLGGGGIVWFLGEMEGDQSSPTELKEGGGHKTLTTNEGSVEFYRDSWRAQIR